MIPPKKLGNNKAAEKYLASVAQRFADHSITYNALLHLGALYYQSQKYLQALRVYKKASDSKDPKVVVEALYWLGEVYTSQKKYNEALQIFLKIPQQFPKAARWVVMAQFRAAGIYEHQNKFSEALDLYKKIKKNKGDKSFHLAAEQRIKKLQPRIKKIP